MLRVNIYIWRKRAVMTMATLPVLDVSRTKEDSVGIPVEETVLPRERKKHKFRHLLNYTRKRVPGKWLIQDAC